MNNILKVLGIIVVVVIVAAAGFGLYWYNEQNPKGCKNLVTSKYLPVFEIYDGISYPNDSKEMTPIYGIYNSCMAIVQGKNTSMDKCKALNNLNESLSAIYMNSANSGTPQAKDYIKQFVADFKTELNKTTASTCTKEYAAIQEQLAEIDKELNTKPVSHEAVIREQYAKYAKTINIPANAQQQFQQVQQTQPVETANPQAQVQNNALESAE